MDQNSANFYAAFHFAKEMGFPHDLIESASVDKTRFLQEVVRLKRSDFDEAKKIILPCGYLCHLDEEGPEVLQGLKVPKAPLPLLTPSAWPL